MKHPERQMAKTILFSIPAPLYPSKPDSSRSQEEAFSELVDELQLRLPKNVQVIPEGQGLLCRYHGRHVHISFDSSCNQFLIRQDGTAESRTMYTAIGAAFVVSQGLNSTYH